METHSTQPGGTGPDALLAHASWLRGLAAHLVSDPASADDVVQETWVAALRNPPRPGRSLRPWLARVVHNAARKGQRGDGRRRAREARVEPGDPAPAADEVVERLEWQGVLVRGLLRLDEPLRTTLVLRYFEDKTSAEIAAIQDVPAGTVRWRIKRGLDELRGQLDRDHGGSRSAWCVALASFADRGALVPPAVGVGATATSGVLIVNGLKWFVGLVALAVAGVLWWQSPENDERHAVEVMAQAPESLDTPTEEQLAEPVLESGESRDERAAPAVAEAPVETPEPGPAADPLSPARITASFVDRDGLPIAGASLRPAMTLGGGETWSAEADADGLLEHTLSAPSGRFGAELVASAPGFASRHFQATFYAGETTHLGELRLGPGAVLYGQVVDPDGAAVAGASVFWAEPELEADGGVTPERGAQDRLARFGPKETLRGGVTASNEGGFFELTNVPLRELRVWAHAEGMRYVASDVLTVAPESTGELLLEIEPLRREDRITGRVIDAEGQPLPEASLHIEYQGVGWMGSRGLDLDEDGSFDLLVHASGLHAFTASDPEGEWAAIRVEEVTPGTRDLVLQLGEKQTLEVHASDLEGRPVEHFGAQLIALGGEHLDSFRQEEREGGVAEFAMPAFACEVTLEAEGFHPQTREFTPADGSGRWDVELEPLARATGQVLANGKPIAGASVQLRRVPSGRLEMNGFLCRMEFTRDTPAKTDDEGRFEVAVPRTGEYFVLAQAEGWSRAELGPLQLSAVSGQSGLELELPRAGVLEGRVLLPDGRGGEGVVVGINNGDGAARTQRAGTDGEFRFEDLAPGEWQVMRRDAELSLNTSSSTYGGDYEPLEYQVRVFPGRTSFYDLNLAESD